MSIIKWILFVVLGTAIMIGIAFGLGYLGVGYTKTVGKAQQNANRTVFEQTQSYVEGKRQELVKFHYEWTQATTDIDKKQLKL